MEMSRRSTSPSASSTSGRPTASRASPPPPATRPRRCRRPSSPSPCGGSPADVEMRLPSLGGPLGDALDVVVVVRTLRLVRRRGARGDDAGHLPLHLQDVGGVGAEQGTGRVPRRAARSARAPRWRGRAGARSVALRSTAPSGEAVLGGHADSLRSWHRCEGGGCRGWGGGGSREPAGAVSGCPPVAWCAAEEPRPDRGHGTPGRRHDPRARPCERPLEVELLEFAS